MKAGVVIISRGRADRFARLAPAWEAQGLPTYLLVEPDEEETYRRALQETAAFIKIIPHAEPDRGIGYARASSVRLADSLGFRSYVMADDDTVPTKGSVRKLLDFVEREVAVNCGGWLSIHNLWYGTTELDGVPIEQRDDVVYPHFGDKLYATNVRLALEVGNYPEEPLADYDTAEWNRMCTAAGYLWWIHSGVRIKEVGAARAPGGINHFHEGRGSTRELARQTAAREIVKRWEPYATLTKAGLRFRKRDFIRDFLGEEAVRMIYDGPGAFLETDDVPRRPDGFTPVTYEQEGLFG